ncbi:glyoxalase superfamily protein [Peterkaempfera sp. SMS 1(5)a]|uniref:glyoxalase superfamily protein n=1 Tax=Peterkaempfera podocarpi TaxID=3232308 RepID=UPI00366F131D
MRAGPLRPLTGQSGRRRRTPALGRHSGAPADSTAGGVTDGLLYAQVSRAAAVLHLSEHHGDGSPNGVVCFPVRDVVGLHKELLARPNAPLRPGIDMDAPGGPTLQVIDPYGNVLRFAQSPSAQQAGRSRS